IEMQLYRSELVKFVPEINLHLFNCPTCVLFAESETVSEAGWVPTDRLALPRIRFFALAAQALLTASPASRRLRDAMQMNLDSRSDSPGACGHDAAHVTDREDATAWGVADRTAEGGADADGGRNCGRAIQ